MSFEIGVTQTSATSVTIFMTGSAPQDPVDILQYNSVSKKFVKIGQLTTFLEVNGISVTGLTAGTTYEWVGVDTVEGTVSNVVRKLIQPTTPSVQLTSQITKSENVEIPQFTVAISITGNQGITDKVLVIHRKPDGTDEFWCIASPAQISEFAEDSPSSPSNFFRVASFSKTFKDVHTASAFVTRVKNDLDYIVTYWKDLLEFNFKSEVNTHSRS